MLLALKKNVVSEGILTRMKVRILSNNEMSVMHFPVDQQYDCSWLRRTTSTQAVVENQSMNPCIKLFQHAIGCSSMQSFIEAGNERLLESKYMMDG